MSKKDLSVLKLKKFNLNIKNSLIYSNFKLYLEKSIKKKTFLIAVSGGPDSLALTALSKIYTNEKTEGARDKEVEGAGDNEVTQMMKENKTQK